MLFAVVSIPLVAAWLFWFWSDARFACCPGGGGIDPVEALALASGSALTASVVGGGVAGVVVRSYPRVATGVAVLVSWVIGVSMLSVTATGLGLELHALDAVDLCEGGCSPPTMSSPVSALASYVAATGPPFIADALPFALAAAVVGAAIRPTSRLRLVASTAFVVAACGILNAWSAVFGLVPFLCLGLGAIAWTALLVDIPTLRAPAS